MKKTALIPLLIACFFIAIVSCSPNEKRCIIKGRTVGVENRSIFLFKAGDDLRFGGIEIPIADSVFECEIEYIYPERYQLALNKYSIPDGVPTFFTEPGEIHLIVFPDEKFDQNTVIGGKLNKEYHDFWNEEKGILLPLIKPIDDSLEIIFNAQSNINDTIKRLENEFQINQNSKRNEDIKIKIQDLNSSKNDLADKEEIIYKRVREIYQKHFGRQLEYVNNNTSIVSYYLLYEVLNRNKDEIDLDLATNYYNKLSEKFPDHPYTELVGNLLESIKSINVGGRYIDFSAPDLNGKAIKLSEIIDGKIALIDLWSTWCSPCILQSRSLIPVYEEFKTKGFTIIGVAANRDRNEIVNMIEKEKYPWTTLVEVDKQNKIWEKYGISNSGGAIYLVDKDGKIISISPSTDEILNTLREILK